MAELSQYAILPTIGYVFPASGSHLGYLGSPQNSQSGDYTLTISDSGKTIYHPVNDNVTRTFTIPSSVVTFLVGTSITFINMAPASSTIAIATDTLYLGGAGTTGSRTLAQYGIATAIKLTSTTWIITGTGLT